MKKISFAQFKEAIETPEEIRKDIIFPNAKEFLREIERVIHVQYILSDSTKPFFGKPFARRIGYRLEEDEKLFVKTKLYDVWGRRIKFFGPFCFVSRMERGVYLFYEED